MNEDLQVKVRPRQTRAILPDDWSLLFVCFAFSQAIGLITYWVLPLLAGSLMTGLHLSATQVGFLGTIEFSGLFLSSLALAPFIDRGIRRQAAWASVIVVISVNLLCGTLELDMTGFAVLRFIAGLGAGLALTIGNASIANGVNPEKLSGHLTLLLVGFMMILMPTFAFISEHYGHRGVFLALAGTVALGALTTPFVPRGPNEAVAAVAGAEQAGPHVLLALNGIMLMLVALFFGLRDTLPWLVAEKIGTETGMSLQQIGTLLSVMYGISIIGPIMQLFLSRIMPPKVLLALSLAVAGLFLWLFTLANGSAVQFSIGIVVWATIYFMAYAQLYAVAALIDRKGRLASALGGAFIGGIAIAPFIGGYLNDMGGYDAIGYAEIGLTVLMVICTMAIVSRGVLARPAAKGGMEANLVSNLSPS